MVLPPPCHHQSWARYTPKTLLKEREAVRQPDVTLKIPRPLYERLAKVIEGTGFHSVTEFSVYVLRDLVAAHHTDEGEEMSHEEVSAVRRRLRALGYLDS
jgi:hypothetical protein